MISFPFVILLTQICLILTSISNYYDRKIWRLFFTQLDSKLQCNAMQYTYSHLHVITIIQMHVALSI